jgi:hypothetical protein
LRNWWNEDWQGKPKYSEKTCPNATLFTTNPTCTARTRTRGAAVGRQLTPRNFSINTLFAKITYRKLKSLLTAWGVFVTRVSFSFYVTSPDATKHRHLYHIAGHVVIERSRFTVPVSFLSHPGLTLAALISGPHSTRLLPT